MPNHELCVVVMPSGALQTEWIETKEKIPQSSRLLQEEIFNRFVADADTGLLFLGFCDKNVSLSPSLEYWRDFAGLFTRGLSRTPDLELFRHQTHIPADTHQLDHFASCAPLMPGSEYIGTELLKKSVKPAAGKVRTKTPAKISAAKRTRPKHTDTEQLLTVIKRSRKGVDVATLRQKTGFDEKKIRNMIYKAHKEGKIRRAGRGIYLGL